MLSEMIQESTGSPKVLTNIEKTEVLLLQEKAIEVSELKATELKI